MKPPPLPEDFWEQVAELSGGQQGVIADMQEAGIDMTRQGYAVCNWGQDIDDLDAEQLSQIPDILPDHPDRGTEPDEAA